MRHWSTTVLLAFAAATVSVAAQTPAPTPAASTPVEIEAFAASLAACTASTLATPHPFVRAFMIEHTITKEDAGKCDYRQTMPGKMTMICGLSVEGRTLLAAEIRNMVPGGAMRGGTSAPPTQWMKECEIESPSGVRSPAVSGRGRGGQGLASQSPRPFRASMKAR
jgi:hypothetical protein